MKSSGRYAREKVLAERYAGRGFRYPPPPPNLLTVTNFRRINIAKKITLDCAQCNISFEKALKEYRRQRKLGRDYFFCSRSCSATYGNSLRDNLRQNVEKQCQLCGKSFSTMTGCKEASFCSRSCASKGSVTAYRRKRAHETGTQCMAQMDRTEFNAAGLRKREAWKYVEIKAALKRLGIAHQFEYPLDPYIFDLALLDMRVFIEFDARYHDYAGQQRVDTAKTQHAKDAGWRVMRVQTNPDEVICASSIVPYVENQLTPQGC